MANVTSTRATAGFPATLFAGAGVVNAAWGSVTLTANPTAADIFFACKIPAGATVIGGWLRGTDIDTGTAALDIDVGWAANGGSGVGATADPDGFGNFGVLNGTAVTNYLPESGFLIPLHGTLATGPIAFDAETSIQAVFNAPANAGGTGTLTLVVLYLAT
jgi:hypothetical protein